MMKQSRYHIPVLPSNLRKEETIKQFTDALTYLENVSDDVFKRVDQQVKQQTKKLEDIHSRLEVAKRKIEHIKGSNKAIQVFSCSKYPADEELTLYQTIFKDVEISLQNVTSSYKKVHSKHLALSDNQLKDKTQFFLVPRNRSKSANSDQSGEGLGGLPNNINAISSLLLFNSSENPYKKYSIFDPLGATTKTKSSLEEQSINKGPGDAPMSISNREQMERPSAENYFYIPDLGDVPEIDVPMDLPDLPGVADLSFSSQLNDGIAPSLMAISSIPDLPEVVNEATIKDSTSAPSPSSVPPPPAPTNALPPPPPPSAAPPPPPPPPAAPPTTTPKEVPVSVGNPDAGRSDLLASIRAAGGSGKAKLKSSKERKLEKKKAKEEAKASTETGGGDLMSDLFNKLAMRRKGISGSKTGGGGGVSSESTGGGSAMDKISAMIPPPSHHNQSNNKDNDNDWD